MAQQLLPAAASDAVNPQIDRVATVLIAATAATSGLLTLYGLNSDRIWVVLDDNVSRWLLLLAGLFALLAIGLALYSYIFTNHRVKSALVGVGAFFYILALLAAVFAAANSANVKGRASIVDMSVARSDGGLVVAFEVTGASIDDDERLGVRLLDVTNDVVLVESFPRATAGALKLTVSMPVASGASELLLQVWTVERAGDAPVCPEAQAGDAAERSVAADCLRLSPLSVDEPSAELPSPAAPAG